MAFGLDKQYPPFVAAMTDTKRKHRIRESVIQRDGMICCYCNKLLTAASITMEHIVPESKRGTFNTTNLTVSCTHCNGSRGNKPFFNYIKRWNFSKEKLMKYQSLYFNNLRIKILNICSKQLLDGSDCAIPQDLINDACDILRIKPSAISYQEFIETDNFSFTAIYRRNEIIYFFENLIKLIESRS